MPATRGRAKFRPVWASLWKHCRMTEQTPEFNKLREDSELRHIELSEQKSIAGSGQTIGLDADIDFVAPTMALDSYEPDSDA